MKAKFVLSFAMALSASPFCVAQASLATTGPGAILHKLDDRWVSILPETTKPAEAPAQQPASAAPAAAPQPSAPAAAVANLSSTPAQAPAEDAAQSALAELQASLPPVDPNYSGSCHVTGDLFSKTYKVNETSSTEMVRELPHGSACFASERSARQAGFSRETR